MPERPEIVCICGSARFVDEMRAANRDLADRVLVVNPGGYVGESTRGEIAYARATGTPVTYTD